VTEPHKSSPNYGNWVPLKLAYLPGLLSLFALAGAFVFPLILAALALFLPPFVYFLYARYLFSPGGADVQNKILGLLLSHLDWNGKGRALDIGCGNAPLAIKLAHKYPQGRIVGVDYWGTRWDYSKSVCEENGRAEGVGDRLSFEKASASDLPFKDGAFDVAVSNLVFHEVDDARDKREVIREALRVVKKGGRFVFQDLFLLKRLYGEPDDLAATIRSWGVKEVEFIRTSDSPFIPVWLKLPFMVGRMGIIKGEK
jgi:SAM-dependent methyltransferase